MARGVLKTTAELLRDYERATYYAGSWTPAYQRWVDMLAGLFNGPGKDSWRTTRRASTT